MKAFGSRRLHHGLEIQFGLLQILPNQRDTIILIPAPSQRSIPVSSAETGVVTHEESLLRPDMFQEILFREGVSETVSEKTLPLSFRLRLGALEPSFLFLLLPRLRMRADLQHCTVRRQGALLDGRCTALLAS